MSDKKTVVITGAGSGIGAATAKLFAEKGFQLVLSDISMDKLTETSSQLSEAQIELVQTDVSDYKQVQDLVLKAVEKFDQIDVFVNNAGVQNSKMLKTAGHEIDDWNNVIAINQNSVFYGLKYAIQQMLKQGQGNIVNVASLAGLKASKNNLAYTASKFAVVGMTKSAALEYAKYNIRINCVCPSYTKTPLLDNALEANPQLKGRLLPFVPMKRYGKPEEVADAIFWLSSDNSSFITGQHIVLDGGLSL